MWLLPIVGSIVLTGIAIYLFVDWAALLATANDFRFAPILFLASLIVLSVISGAIRWYVLVRSLKVPIRLLKVINITFLANGLNIVIPGGIAGDFFKGAAIARLGGQGFGVALGSSVADRVIGLHSLVVSLAGAIWLSATTNSDFDLVFLLSSLFSVLAAIVAVRLLVRWLDQRITRGAGLMRKLLSVTATTLGTLTAFRRKPLVTGLAFVLGVLGHLLVCSGLWYVAGGLATVTFSAVLTAILLSYLASLVPVSVYGLGARELIFVAVLVPAGLTQEQAVLLSLLWFTVTMTVSLGLAGVAAALDRSQFRAALEAARSELLSARMTAGEAK